MYGCMVLHYLHEKIVNFEHLELNFPRQVPSDFCPLCSLHLSCHPQLSSLCGSQAGGPETTEVGCEGGEG